MQFEPPQHFRKRTPSTRLQRRLGRRALLRAAGRAGVGVAALALVGCGGDDDDAPAPDATPPATDATATDPPPTQSSTPATPDDPPPRPRLETAQGAPRPGGVLRLHASLTDIDLFDIHRSRFPLTQRFSALQQSRLLRYADINSGTLEPDLVAEWETPDDESYVLLLRPGLRWGIRQPTSGRPFTGEDVRRNIERQIAGVDAAGDPDPLFQRQRQFERTSAVDLVDEETVVLRTNGPVGGYMGSVIAGPWSFLQAPEAWEQFGDRMRDDPLNPAYYTGTGPFQMQRLIPEGIAAFSANPGYFRDARPYLDTIEFAHLPTAASQESAYRQGDIDLWSPGDPLAIDPLLADYPDDRVVEQPLPFPIQIAFSAQGGADNPFSDRRLALALHRALDRDAVMAAIYGPHAGLSGPAPWFASGWAPDVFALRERPGYRAALSADEATELQLLASSVRGPSGDLTASLPLTVPDLFEQSYPGLAADTAASLSARLGISVRPVVDRYSHIVEGLGDGAVPLFLGWGPAATDADPTLDLHDAVHTGGPANWGGFSDPAIDAALDQMDRTADRAERQRIYRDTLEPLLLDTPAGVLNVGHGIQRSLYRSDVSLPRFGFGWDAHHLERAWRVT